MSFRNVQENTIENRNTLSVPISYTAGNAARGAGAGWIRNPAWPALPSITASDEKVVGLYAVFPNTTFIALTVNTSAGTYTVNWGDGTTSNHTGGVQANYTYDYNDADLAGTDAPVTFTDAGDTVDRNNHGYPNGYPISFFSITTTTGITAGQIYYVVNAATNTFQLAATPGGAVLPLTNDGTGVILPYKIATITITPTTVGATLTSLSFDVRNSSTSNNYVNSWLDMALAGSFTGVASPFYFTGGLLTLLEQVRILRHRMTSLASLFRQCYKLQNVVEITAAAGINVTATNNMFQDCTSLQTVPLFNTAAVTTMSSMFNGCRSLKTIPLFSTSSVNNMSFMFSSCSSLQTVPLFNTAAVTTMSSMFSGCTSLQTVPLFNTAAVTTMSSMFSSCPSLQTVPLFNTAAVTVISSMFSSCSSLQTVPLFNTAAVTTMSSMFSSCSSLQTVPLFNTAAVINMNSMFGACTSLQTVPLFNTAAVTDMSSMFGACSSLQTVPLFNTAAVTNMSSMFSGCTSLQTVPLFNTAAVTNMTGMFSTCISLQTVPLFNTATVTNMSGMFSTCTALFGVPAFNCSGVVIPSQTGFGSTMSSCVRNQATNIFYSFSITNQSLSASALNEIYTNLPTVQPQGTAVTFQGTADTVTLSSHGYTNGRTVRFTTIVTTTGISTATDYYVRNSTLNTFQLSTTPTGAIINLVNDGTGTLTGQTITVTGNWGTATDNPAIATAKGWTVTG